MEPSTAQVLAVWERGIGQTAGERALSLLALSDEPLETPHLLAPGARDAALLRIRQRMFGNAIEAVAECRRCAEPLEVTLSVEDLLPAQALVPPSVISVEADGCRVEMRVPTAGDLAALYGAHTLEGGMLQLLRRCVLATERDGCAIEVDAFTAPVHAALNSSLAAIDPGGDTILDVVCPACGAENSPLFDAPSFLWREAQQLARDTLLDVHDLARAYGWTEPDILALSPARRRFYLEANAEASAM